MKVKKKERYRFTYHFVVHDQSKIRINRSVVSRRSKGGYGEVVHALSVERRFEMFERKRVVQGCQVVGL